MNSIRTLGFPPPKGAPVDESGTSHVRALERELENFHDIASRLLPEAGELPRLRGFDIHGETIPLHGVLGGDHLIYLDFEQRFDLDARIARALEQSTPEIAAKLEDCRRRTGIVLADVAGHRITDALLAAMLHQAFLLGTGYELDRYGEITRNLFENLNMRFYRSSAVRKFITMIYGEMIEDGRFRFISAAHPTPLLFCGEEDRFVRSLPDSNLTSPPLGTMPSQHGIDRTRFESALGFKDEYVVNEWRIDAPGDILLLCTDGLIEHGHGDAEYFPGRLEERVRALKNLPAAEIVAGVKEDLLSFAPLADDVSLVVIKRQP